MPRVLLGWEIGAQRGHVLRMRDIAVRLRAAGLTIAWAALRIDQLEGIALADEPVYQSPVWPGLHLESLLSRPRRTHRSHADLLADLGLSLPGAFRHLLLAWDAILAVVQPAAVFADYAPALLSACRGRIPTVAAGIGFTLPPAHLERFPLFPNAFPDTEPPAETDLLTEANAGLSRTGRPLLAHLPALFSADRVIVSSFKELDPFAAHRLTRQAPPSLMNWSPPAALAGDEIIVYAGSPVLNTTDFLDALRTLNRPVRVVAPGLAPDDPHLTPYGNVSVQTQPLHFAEIARRARLLISNGNTGFVSAGMLAGLPQAVLHYDLQKQLVGDAIQRLGLGVSDHLRGIDWDAWKAKVGALYDDPTVRTRAVRLAGPLVGRMHQEPADLCACALQIMTKQSVSRNV